MKRLVVIPCFGNIAHAFCAELTALSLRQLAHFDGDIFAVTDQAPLMVPSGLVKNAQMKYMPLQAGNPFRSKLLAKQYVPYWNFDSILWLDCDIIAIADIVPLFATGQEVLYSEELLWGMTDDRFSRCSSSETLKQMGDRRGINSGSFSIRADRFGEAMDRWQYLFNECGCNQDQQSFNDLIVTGQLLGRAYPEHWVEFPSVYRVHNPAMLARIDDTTKLLHYCGARTKAKALRFMENDFSKFGGRRMF